MNGDYFAIPPLKLRGALTGTYLHLIEGTGNVVLGPSEISLKATDVKLVGTNASVVKSFGYALKLNGQERHYKGTDYKGIYFVGSKELELNLPNDKINALVLKSSIDVGAFGGVNAAKDKLYLGVGANAIVKGRVQVPDDIRVIGGIGVDVGNINLVVGGQTTAPIRGVSVSEGMKQAFKNMDVYLGAMVGVNIRLVDTRVWVLIPQIVQTDFKRGEGWDFEIRFLGSLPEWNWADKGIEPIVRSFALQSAASSSVESSTYSVSLSAAPTALSYTEDFTVAAGPDETPYIVLAFNNSVTEDKIKNALTIKKDGSDLPIHWLGSAAQMDPDAEINAMTIADMKKSPDDGKEYRLAVLRLKEGGTYTVNSGALEFTDKKSFAVEPFEKLELTQNDYALSGQVKYPVENTTYVLRTYLGSAKGDTSYLVSEDTVVDTNSISLRLPDRGALAPTGEYYVTSFLMTEKTFTLADGSTETALMPVGNQCFDTPIFYTNINQPNAPVSVDLTPAGNEVMRANWSAVDGADGYHVTIYQHDGTGWIDTGYGYDLGKDTTSLDMALTVGGNAVQVSESGASSVPAENLSADKTYKIGVRAYRVIENGKYYSAETESGGKFLPKYTPLNITLDLGGVSPSRDENGVFHAYVRDEKTYLCVTCDQANDFTVTRMDTGAEAERDPLSSSNNDFVIPDFTGTLMLKIDAVKGKDVTSVFLLVSRDETPPVLTLSDPIFYADKDTGAYSITGTADAGSLILYDSNESVYAGSDGSFEIPGTLDGNQNTRVLPLQAQDSAGNLSTPQFALVTRRGTTYNITFDGNGGTPSVDSMTTTGQKLASLPSASRIGSYRFDGWYTAANGGTEITTSTVFSADTTVYAHWTYVGKDDQPDTFYTINVTAGKGGTTSPSGSVRVREGGSLTLTITPDKGYVVSSVKIDGKSVGAVKSYTLTNVMGSHAITVTFRKAGSPVSGDSGGLPLWNALLCASAFGLACAVFPRRKRRLG